MAGAAPHRSYLLAMAPAALVIGSFFLIPAIWAIAISMTPLSLLGIDAGSTRFIGLDNYRRLIDDPDFTKYLKNTFVFVFGVAVVGMTFCGLVIALLIDHAEHAGSRLASAAFAAVVLAGICPPALAGAIWGGILDYRTGVVNDLLVALGFERVDFLGDFSMFSVVLAESWRMIALGMFIFYGVLRALPRQTYEAASLDGADDWQVLRDITLPQIRRSIGLVLTIATIIAGGSFILNEILTGGGTSRQTETLALYAWHVAFVDFEVGFGAAISVVILAATGFMSLIYFRVASDER